MGQSLPVGFEERLMGRGMVVKGWAPQLSMLAHRAVGGFFTHCGTSSLVDGVGQGKPLRLVGPLEQEHWR